MSGSLEYLKGVFDANHMMASTSCGVLLFLHFTRLLDRDLQRVGAPSIIQEVEGIDTSYSEFYLLTWYWSMTLGVLDLVTAMLDLQGLLKGRFLDLSEQSIFVRAQDPSQANKAVDRQYVQNYLDRRLYRMMRRSKHKDWASGLRWKVAEVRSQYDDSLGK